MNRYAVISFLLMCVLVVSSAVVAAEEPDTLFEEAVTAFNAGNYEDAIALWEKALPLYKAAKDDEHHAMVLNNIGLVYFYMRQYEKSIGYFNDALIIDRKREISKDIATDLQNLGMAYYQTGRYDLALIAFEESAVVFDSITNTEGEAKNLYNVGIAHFALGNITDAGRFFSAAADLHRGLRDREGYVLDIMGLGDVFAELERFDKAMENYEEALRVREVLGDPIPYIKTRIKIARALGDAGRYEEALEYLTQAKKDAKKEESDSLMGDVIGAWGDVLNSSGDADGALESYEEALLLMKKGNDLPGAGMILTNKGILLGELLRFSEAKKSFEDARLIYQVTKDPRNEAKVAINLGNLLSAMGDDEGALSYYDQADTLLGGEKGGAVSGANHIGIGEIYLKKNDLKKAGKEFEIAKKLMTGERDRRYAAKIDAYLGLVDYYGGNYASALTRFNDSLSILRKENARSLVADILIGTGMALVENHRPEVAGGYFLEAKRLADDLIIVPVGWRAVYCDGLIKEVDGDAATARARWEDALFRLCGVPEVAPMLYGARIVTIEGLFEKLSSGDTEKTRNPSTGLSMKKEGIDRITELFIGDGNTFTKKEQRLVDRIVKALGEVNYLQKRLADDEYRKGNNTDRFTAKILSAQGEYLKTLDDIRDDEPGLWDTYFKSVYE